MSISTTIGDDVYGFLNLLSRRQGPHDSTVPLPFAGNPPGTPAVSPQQGGPVPPALPFTEPVPSASRRVQVARAGPATMSDATPGPAPAPDTAPAVAKTATPVVAANQKPVPDVATTGSTRAVAPSQAGAAAAALAAPGEDPQEEYRKYLEAQAAQQKKNNLISGFAQSGMLLAGVLSRDPALRSMMSQHAGQFHLGGGGGGGAGGLKFEDFAKMREYGQAAAAQARTLAEMPAIAKRTGIALGSLRTIFDTKPEHYSALVSDMEKPDNAFQDMGDGRIRVYNKKHPDETLRIIGDPDPYKVSKERREEEQLGINKQAEQRQLDKANLDLKDREQRLAAVPEIMRRNPGLTEGAAIALAQEGGAGWQKAVSKDAQLRTLENGTIVSIDVNDPEAKPTVVGVDPTKAKKEAAALAGTEATTRSTLATAATTEEKNLKEADFRKLMSDPESRRVLAQTLGMNENELTASYLSGTSDELIKNRLTVTPLYQEWLQTDKKKDFTQYAKEHYEKTSPQPTFGRGIIENQMKTVGEKTVVRDKLLTALPETGRRYEMLVEGKGLVGGFYGSDSVRANLGWFSDLFGQPVKSLEDAQDIANSVRREAIDTAKALGVNPTDLDLKENMKARGGDLSQTREALIQTHKYQMRAAIRSAFEVDKELQAMKSLAPDDPMVDRYIQAKTAQLPDHVNQMFPKEAVDKFMLVATSTELTPTQKQIFYQRFDKDWGDGLAAYVRAKRGIQD